MALAIHVSAQEGEPAGTVSWHCQAEALPQAVPMVTQHSVLCEAVMTKPASTCKAMGTILTLQCL